ncbi:hypothetical protein GOV09_05340 [Candidatus Woesearchaeota archaeon]|nr:hypothetical protein [Candidatus Woesearchaeota archaeon]
MGEVNQVVDHLKLEYKGIFNIKELFGMFGRWYKESPYEKGGDYISEQRTHHGKCIEYVYWPWKKQTDYIRHYMKLRILIYDAKKVDVMVDGKKQRLDHARFLLYLDGFVENDYESRWRDTPLFMFIRTLASKFFYKRYAKFMERMVIDDCHHLYEKFERFFNMYRSFRPVKKQPHFYY